MLRASLLGLLTIFVLGELLVFSCYILPELINGPIVREMFTITWWTWPIVPAIFVIVMSLTQRLLLLPLLLVSAVSTLVFERTRLRHHQGRYALIVSFGFLALYLGLALVGSALA